MWKKDLSCVTKEADEEMTWSAEEGRPEGVLGGGGVVGKRERRKRCTIRGSVN
jgi:hypothetical protein